MPNASPDGIVATRKEAAKLLGDVSPQTLTLWTKEPWFPQDAVGKNAKGRRCNWNVPAIRAARDALHRKGSGQSQASLDTRQKLDEQKLRRETIRADREAREEAINQGNILPRDEQTLSIRELITLTRDRLMTEPSREVAKHFPEIQREVFEVHQKQMAKILNDFARELEQIELALPEQTAP